MTTGRRPNIVFIMSDDHAAHAISAYGSRVNETPQIDRLARDGMRLDNCFCANALCAPSRASILTGTYNHVNGMRTLTSRFDSGQPTFPRLLRESGYATAVIGKWHLGHGTEHDPCGFDEWIVLEDQGSYWNPTFLTRAGERALPGYTSDVITDLAIDWLDRRSADQPFCLLVHHKAPHRSWEPHPRYADRYTDVPLPETWDDDYSYRASAAAAATMRVRDHLLPHDLKEPMPAGLTAEEEGRWKYQRYMSDYLRCVASVDDSVGRILDHLDATGLADDTIVAYTSDQGFFLGDHGWYDKRFMYEESLRMPFLVRYPREIPAGSTSDALVSNVDFAQTFLDYAGIAAPERMQGRSLRQLWGGKPVGDWRDAVYYRYWEHDDGTHHVRAHYGVRTRRYKLVFYYADGLGLPGASDQAFEPEWELFDLERDPHEMHSVYDDPAYERVRADLTETLARMQRDIGDTPYRQGRTGLDLVTVVPAAPSPVVSTEGEPRAVRDQDPA